MINLMVEYPFVNLKGDLNDNLIKHYAKDDEGKLYYIKQVQTGVIFEQAVDIYPCSYSYEATNIPITEEEQYVGEDI